LIYGLRWQLLLSMVAVILVTVGMTAFFANQAANAEIERVQGRDDAVRSQQLADVLASRYFSTRDWTQAQQLVDDAGALYQRSILLTDLAGVVIADNRGKLLGRRLELDPRSRSTTPVFGPEGRLGTLIIDPNLPPGARSAVKSGLESSGPSLNVLLILSGLLAAAVAMVLTFFLSRRVVAPVESLAKVAQSVAQRDFSVRAEVKSRDEVGELSRIFNSMIEELSSTEELRRNLVADLAHELRTPVTNIQGYIEGIADGVMTPDTTTLAPMHDEVILLARLIDDLQDLALAESGHLPFLWQSCELGGIAQRALAAVQQRAQARQITLRVDVPAELPLQADPERISQVLRNLLVNAVEYTPPGGQVSLLAWEHGPVIQLAVRDTGPGIPERDLPYIFERFYRVDKSRSRATGGVGLGFTIARRLVEAHGGNIEARSEPGQGTEFMVRLPRNGVALG
jgi:signal transduction histidine kinase